MVGLGYCARFAIVITYQVPFEGRQTVRALGPAEPVPCTATECGDPGALSEMTSVARREPTPTGLKVTEMLQLALAANVEGQPLFEMKSAALAPSMEILLMVIAAPVVFVMVKD